MQIKEMATTMTEFDEKTRNLLEAERRRLVVLLEQKLSHYDLTDVVDAYIIEAIRDQIKAIDHAVDRLEAGAYGICENCQIEIEEERLSINIATRLCAACAHKAEPAKRLPV